MPSTRKEILKARMAAQLRDLVDAWEAGDECVFCDEDGTEKCRGKIVSMRVNSDRLEDGVTVRMDHPEWPIEMSAFQVAPAKRSYEEWKMLGVPSDALEEDPT